MTPYVLKNSINDSLTEEKKINKKNKRTINAFKFRKWIYLKNVYCQEN